MMIGGKRSKRMKEETRRGKHAKGGRRLVER